MTSAGGSSYLNRELSWLDFASRVLDLAEEDKTSLGDRAKFLAIVSSGLDEFFQVRVAGLKDQEISPKTLRSPDGLTPAEQLHLIRQGVLAVAARAHRIYSDIFVPALRATGTVITAMGELDTVARRRAREVFQESVYPILTPLGVDPTHPFPYISNLSLNLGVALRERGEIRFARVKVPSLIERLVEVSEGTYVFVEDLIEAHLSELFGGVEIVGSCCFRVTRNADLVLEEGEAEDLVSLVELELRRRRFGRAVRFEVAQGASLEVTLLFRRELELGEEDVYESPAPLGFGFAWAISARQTRDDPSFEPRIPCEFEAALDDPPAVFSQIAKAPVLVHHPYDSFSESVEAFVAAAADDPATVAIKQTLYRTSGDSTIIASLVRAAESGKEVVVLVEVKARFDELANIGWARQLEEAGVHVVYGVVGLKTHCKAILVVRREEDKGLVRYCHLGTGNYNARTATTYEDFGLFSVDERFGDDLTELFNYLTGFARPHELTSLVLSPSRLRSWLLAQISGEITKGEGGEISFKVNALADPEIIDALMDADRAGVRVRGIVRGICTLRPREGGSLSIKSIVGRYLEHSRIFIFGDQQADEGTVHLGSADLMTRNLDRRIELLFPIVNDPLRRRVCNIFETDWSDTTNTWWLRPSGSWERESNQRNVCAQELFELAQGKCR